MKFAKQTKKNQLLAKREKIEEKQLNNDLLTRNAESKRKMYYELNLMKIIKETK